MIDESSHWPAQVRTLEDVSTIEALAERVTTPCGEGEMVWRIWGDPQGSPLLLLHGGSGSWNHWVRNLAALARCGRRVLVPDMPGFGDSDAPPDGSDADALPRWLELGVRHLLGARTIDVAGFSFGALTGGLWARDHPGRIDHLVLSGAPSLSPDSLPRMALRDWRSVAEGPERHAVHRDNLLRLMLAQQTSADDLAITLHAANVVRDKLRSRRLPRTDILLRHLPALTCQLSGIWGADDVLYRHRRDMIGKALALAPRFRGLTLIPDAGHWVAFEAADAYDAALASALGHRPGRAAEH
ncbi:MAG: alpha/beta fold hydrolase [Burkholderiaceae bacterium]